MTEASAPRKLGLSLPGYFPLHVGPFDAAVLSDGPIPLPVTDGSIPLPSLREIYPDLDPGAAAAALRDAYVPADPVHIEQNALIIAIEGRLALFDCGCGSSGVFGSATGRLLRSLAEFGVSPADINYLVLSHAHSDHCWGAADDSGAPTFPNARIFLSRAEFEFWAQRDPNDPDAGIQGFRRRLAPLRDRMTFVDDGVEFLPFIRAWSTLGHTPGHASYLIGRSESLLCFAADVLLHPVISFAFANVESVFDHDRAMGVRTRVSFLEKLAASRLRILGYHLPWPGVGFAARSSGAYRFLPEPQSPFA